MKKLLGLFCVFLICSAFQCANEPLDGEFVSETGETSDLEGSWMLVSVANEISSVVNAAGIEFNSEISQEGINIDYTLILDSGNFTTNGSYDIVSEGTVNGVASPTQNYSFDDVNGSGDYSVSGNELTFSEGSLFEFEVDGVDESALTEDQTLTYVLSADGQTLTLNQTQQINQTVSGATTEMDISSISVWTRIGAPVDSMCDDFTAQMNAAQTQFDDSTDENYTQNCNTLKDAIQNVIDNCGSTEALTSQLEALGDCVQDDDTSPEVTGELSVRAGTLPIDFDVITVEREGTLIKVSGETSATTNNNEIYFEVEDTETGMDIINSTFVLTLSTMDADYFPNTDGFDDFTSTITENASSILIGSFSGIVTNSSGADISLTQGVVNIDF